MDLQLPLENNQKLHTFVRKISEDIELDQLYRCANINAVERGHINDHGVVHIKLVAMSALKILRLLIQAGVVPSVVANYQMTNEDAELIVVAAPCFHDIGISIHRDDHEQLSLILAQGKLKDLLEGIYTIRERVIVTSEILHAMIGHRWDVRCLTVEAGAVKLADALDMSKGRSRIPFEKGKVDIHSVSAAAIDSVQIKPGESKPVLVVIEMNNSAGIFQVDELLKRKLRNSGIEQHIEVQVHIEEVSEKRILKSYHFP
ncbi:MAG: HD domain-containing protein [Armatimonadetes bacterium]|nr:HD domain-containing protein [Armatimonadota bacterium]